MRAAVGDEITVPPPHTGDGVRTGEVLAVHGPDGAPPYVVRWSDGHEALYVPGPEVKVAHRAGSS